MGPRAESAMVNSAHRVGKSGRWRRAGFGLAVSVVVPLLIAVELPARPSTPESETAYAMFSRLRNPPLVLTEQAAIRELTLPMPEMTFRFVRGTISRVAPVNGKFTGFYFTGEGWAEFYPSDSGEARILDRYTGQSGGIERVQFSRLFCRFPDWNNLAFSRTPAFVPVLGLKTSDLPLRQPDRWLLLQMAEHRDNVAPDIHPYVELFDEITTGDRPPGSFHAVYGPEASSNGPTRWYQYRPRSREPVAYNGWLRYRPSSTRLEPAVVSCPSVEPVWFDISAKIDFVGHVDFHVEGRYLVTGMPLSRLFLNLAPLFDVTEVTDERKADLDFWTDTSRTGPQGVLVFLGRQYDQGDTIILRFGYNGFPATATDEGISYLPSGLAWFPTPTIPLTAAFDARFTYPSTMTLTASGRKLREYGTAQGRRSFWMSTGGTPDFTFLFGRFGTKDYFYEGMPPVTVCTPRLLSGPDAADSLRGVVSDILNGLNYFQKIFGPYAPGGLTVGEVAVAGHTVYSGRVYLPCRNFEPSGRDAPETECGHGLAGQWWGFVVRAETYRDEWFIEGISEYANALFLEKSRKRRDLAAAVIGTWRDHVTMACDSPAAGPLAIGGRLPERFLLAKGAYVIHMLRMMMFDPDIESDRRFLAMLRDFLEYYRGRTVTAQDFQHQAELYYGQSLDWFFRQWVFGTEIPTYTTHHRSEKESDGKYSVWLDVEQSGVEAQFKMPVPVLITFTQGRPYRGRVWVSGEGASVRLGPFDHPPRNVVFNDLDAVLTRSGPTERLAETAAPR